jgi:hypothetical protein
MMVVKAVHGFQANERPSGCQADVAEPTRGGGGIHRTSGLGFERLRHLTHGASGVNNLSVVHAGSNGISIAFPDVCTTPAPPAPFVPIPYPNIAKSGDTSKGAQNTTCDGNTVCVKDSNFMMSSGDEAGSLMGMISAKIKGKAEFVNFSFDVQIEGKNVPRAMDMMLHNDKNTPPVPVIQGPVVAMASADEDVICAVCGDKM